MNRFNVEPRQLTGSAGLLSVFLFIILFLLFGWLHPSFDYVHDFVSKLGAKGEPNATLWNVLGFGLVGLMLAVFGYAYGKFIKDPLAGNFLGLFGIGFGLIAFPINLESSDNLMSKLHILAVCLGLACWLFGLARISYNVSLDPAIRKKANITAVLIVAAMIGFVINVYSMGVTHRLVFCTVFGWTATTARGLLREATQ